MLESLLDSLSYLKLGKLNFSGELYITVMNVVKKTQDTERVRNMMEEFLREQSYQSLGHIYVHAKNEKIDWLEQSAHHRVVYYFPSIRSTRPCLGPMLRT